MGGVVQTSGMGRSGGWHWWLVREGRGEAIVRLASRKCQLVVNCLDPVEGLDLDGKHVFSV